MKPSWSWRLGYWAAVWCLCALIAWGVWRRIDFYQRCSDAGVLP